MDPRQRIRHASAAAATAERSLLSLPDALLVECLRHVPQKDRLQHVALVNKRLDSLCLAPQLLRTLQVAISGSGSAAVHRAQALLGLLTAHGGHVRHLELDVQLPEDAADEEHNEVSALIPCCLAACAAAGGGPETLLVSAATPLASTAPLAGLTQLQKLEGLGSVQQELRLPELSKLTALHSANMSGKTIRLGGTLPPSLTYLGLEGAGKEDTMPPVANLTGLRYLSLVDCAYTEGSMRQLSTLQLRELDLLDGTTIPPCLSALGQLACLSVNTCSRNDVATLGAALSALSSLRRLGLIAWDPAWRRLPPAITSLRKLERLCLYSSAAEVEADALPGGAWLASVQWLCVPYRMAADAAATGVLSTAAQLKYFATFGWPEEAARGEEDEDSDAAWDAFWAFLASHPALRCFAVDTFKVSGSGAAPSIAAVDALVDLQHQRPELQFLDVQSLLATMPPAAKREEEQDGSAATHLLAFALGAVSVGATLLLRALQKKLRKRRRVVGVLPARYQSSRFPGKPLVPILGKPMILRTYEQACKATTLDAVVVATDDERIAEACRAAGAQVVMTHPDCANGTERCEEAVSKLKRQYDIVVNIQGDEPLIEPECIDAVVRALQDSPDAVYSTACTPLAHKEVPLRQRVKCITDQNGYAIYFSRGVLPSNKDGEVRSYPTPFQEKPYLLHLGLQCYDRQFLRQYCRMPPTPLQMMEDLEQLKVLENGHRMKVVIVDHSAHGVDLPEDVASIEQLLKQRLGVE